MEHDYHWHWWHWLIIIFIVVVVSGLTFTFINNVKNNQNQSYINGVQQTIEHPIYKTENAVKDVVK